MIVIFIGHTLCVVLNIGSISLGWNKNSINYLSERDTSRHLFRHLFEWTTTLVSIYESKNVLIVKLSLII